MAKSLTQQIVDRIVVRAKQKKISLRQLSLATGFGPDLIRDWKGPKSPLPRIDSLMKVAEILDVSAGWLTYGEDGPNHTRLKNIPIISWVAAGSFNEAYEEVIDETTRTIAVDNLGPGTFFALEVRGESMNMVAPDGSTIIVNVDDRELVPRSLYVFRQGEEVTFKQFMSNPDRLEPMSTDRSFEALPVTGDTTVIGKVETAITHF